MRKKLRRLPTRTAHSHIVGLDPNENYYLQARTVDLDHLGPYIADRGNRTAFIPLWYDNASRINEAVAISPGTFA